MIFCKMQMIWKWMKFQIQTELIDWDFCSLDNGLCCCGNLRRGADSFNGHTVGGSGQGRSVFELLLSLANSKCFGQKSNCSSSWQNSNWWKTNFQIKYWTDWLNFESANTLWWAFRQFLNCCWFWQIRNAAQVSKIQSDRKMNFQSKLNWLTFGQENHCNVRKCSQIVMEWV